MLIDAQAIHADKMCGYLDAVCLQSMESDKNHLKKSASN